ncbi:oligopeptide transporter [Moniliophthora roreri MCA 2997]|uniref:Oligopeptide transporter n=1 Tax=Moniliophthora roreri (strain MCA 2997) TaxID=1381753 RepID=V2Y3S4_MONRO|nr:oligopeptide transporter [Moniliophthora roreri MCA 2997]
METLQTLPKSGIDSENSLNEKEANLGGGNSWDEKKASVVDLSHPGEVHDDIRVIDLGEDGKERPITTDVDVATRLISLEDDPALPCFTFRMWHLGVGLSCFGAVLGRIFYFRPQTIFVSSLFLQVIAYILGIVMEVVLPGPKHENPRLKTTDNAFWRFINPGPFNLKEHVVTIFFSTAGDSATAISIFAADELYYGIQRNSGISIFTLTGSQLIGYGLGGLMRSFLVYPTYIVFPNLLSFCLGGAAGNEGLGMFSICLDWNYVSQVGSGGGAMGALFTPFSTQTSLYFGVMICTISFCAAYATNAWNAQTFPWLSQALYTNEGERYNQTMILDENFRLDPAKLEAYIGSNLAVGATFAHVLIWYGKEIREAVQSYRTGNYADPHMQKMESTKRSQYGGMQLSFSEALRWQWRPAIPVNLICPGKFSLSFAYLYLLMSLRSPGGVSFVALLLAAFFLPFVVLVYAITGEIISFVPNVETVIQMVGRSMMPGSPQRNMYFTLYGYNTVLQARGLIRDVNTRKLPPRVTFTVQVIGTVIGGLLNYLTMKVIVTAQRESLLDIQGTNVWSGQQVQSFNSQAVTWGALSQHISTPGGRYGIVPLAILIGLAVPLPFWIVHRFYPNIHADKVVTPVLCWTLGYLGVGINSSVFTTFLLAVFSQYYLRACRPRWFRKYNFLMSAALDSGTQVMVFVFTFAVGGGSGKVIDFPRWALARLI